MVEIVYEPVKFGYRGGVIFVEVHEDPYGFIEDMEQHARSVAKSRGIEEYVDWEKVDEAIEWKNGVPVPVGTLPKGGDGKKTIKPSLKGLETFRNFTLKEVNGMKSRFIVLMVLIFVAALFTGCATTGDLEKLSAQVKEASMKADQASMKADQAAKDAAAAKASARPGQANARHRACQCSGGKGRAGGSQAEAASAKLAEDNAKKSEAIFMKSMKK